MAPRVIDGPSARTREEATGVARDTANEIWSWDITKLHGPTRGLFYDLYVILDIFSRYVLNWLVAAHEDAQLAKEFIEDAILTQGSPAIRSPFTPTAVGPCAPSRSVS